MLEFLNNKTLALAGVTYNGYHSWRDFDLTIKEAPKYGLPQKKEITESVPYMNGNYNFTYIKGYASYSRRTVTVVFTAYGFDRNEVARKVEQVLKWLDEARGKDMSLDDEIDYIYKDVYANVKSVQLTDEGNRAHIEVEFDCATYRTKGTFKNVLLQDIDPHWTDRHDGGVVYVENNLGEAWSIARNAYIEPTPQGSYVWLFNDVDNTKDYLIAITAPYGTDMSGVKAVLVNVLYPSVMTLYAPDEVTAYYYIPSASSWSGRVTLSGRDASITYGCEAYEVNRTKVSLDNDIQANSRFYIRGSTNTKLTVGANTISTPSGTEDAIIWQEQGIEVM